MRAVLLFAAACSLGAQAPELDRRFEGLRFLIGHWIAGGGPEGQPGSGEFSFQCDAQCKVVVRRNFAEYPGANGKPASRHDDLMVVYGETPGAPLEAVYFDSEGQTIHYRVETSGEGNLARFVSPSYRLTYTKTGADTLSGLFEVAPKDKPGVYSPYLKWTARRRP